MDPLETSALATTFLCACCTCISYLSILRGFLDAASVDSKEGKRHPLDRIINTEPQAFNDLTFLDVYSVNIGYLRSERPWFASAQLIVNTRGRSYINAIQSGAPDTDNDRSLVIPGTYDILHASVIS